MQSIAQSINEKRRISDDLYRAVRAEVRFGIPSRDCRGHGICRVMPVSIRDARKINKRSCYRALAYITVTRKGELKFHFLKRSLCAYTRHKYFKGGVFTVGESVELSPSIAKTLNLDRARVAAGTYPIEEGEEVVSVCFGLRLKIKN